jgi:DNA helicase-2/ATP-dependent DNA helicase PcrA
VSDDVLEGLNPEQRKAAERVTGPICILAGAGSGKTTTITRRIANQVSSGAFRAGEILAVTFTDKAAGEMRTRLRRLGAEGVRASTFHSAAMSQLRVLSHEPIGQILPSKALALRQIANSLPKPYRFRPAADLATEVEWCKNRRIRPGSYLSSLGSHEPPIPGDLMAGVYRKYEDGKRARGLIDFEDLLELAIQMYERDEDAAERFRSRYRALTVDEYQDVNLLQESLLRLWLGGRDDICVVGDDYQSIYGFTGASPKYLLEMKTRYPRTLVAKLEVNYRSTPSILELANRLVPKLGGAEKILRSERDDGAAPAAKGFPSEKAETDLILSEIRRLDTEGIPFEEMAILLRTNYRSDDFEEALVAAGIPFQLPNAAFLNRQTFRQLRSQLASKSSSAVAETVRAMVTKVGYVEDVPDGVGEQELTRQSDLSRALRLAEEFDDGVRTCAEFVADVEARFGSGEGRGVNLLTYHRAKGLEFEAVFLPRLQEGELPFKRARSEEARQEERRLFYVGMTRAKSHLFLTWIRDKKSQPSSFLKEIGFDQSMVRPQKPARSAPRERGIEAAVGMRVHLPGGYRGEVESLHGKGIRVLLDEGASLNVAFGEPITVGDRTAPLEAPLSNSEKAEAALRKWRTERSKADEVPAYVVFHDATLEELVERNPRTVVELAGISGIGPSKIDKYGAELLDVLARSAGEDSVEAVT